jgi:hypothetical protein
MQEKVKVDRLGKTDMPLVSAPQSEFQLRKSVAIKRACYQRLLTDMSRLFYNRITMLYRKKGKFSLSFFLNNKNISQLAKRQTC